MIFSAVLSSGGDGGRNMHFSDSGSKIAEKTTSVEIVADRIESGFASLRCVGVIERYSEVLLVFLAVLFVAVFRGRCDLLV